MRENWDALPLYKDLPVDPARPPRSAWGVFGDDDELGTLNLLTPTRVRAAATLIQRGAIFPLNWALELPNPPLFGRQPLRHTIDRASSGDGTDDHYDDFYPQTSSQWDALSHVGHPNHGFYNGRTMADITGQIGSRNGIDVYARHGLAGRWVLADVERYRRARGRPLRQGEHDAVSVEDIEATLTEQGVGLGSGDILLLRFGWIAWYEGLDAAGRTGPAREASPGLAHGERTAEWLWDRHVAAVASDCPALEAMPFALTVDGFLHYRLLPLLGLAIGELFALDALAADCAADGVYEGFFSAAPLNKIGGSGSTANALAIK